MSIRPIEAASAAGSAGSRGFTVRETIDDILSSSEFSGRSGGGFLERVGHWLRTAVENIGEFFDRLWGRLLGPRNGVAGAAADISPFVAALLKAAGIAAIMLVVAVLCWFVLRNVRRSRFLCKDGAPGAFETLKDWRALEDKAASCSEAGDFRQGLRFLYMALLLRLNEMGKLRIDRAKTNRQYLNELRAAGYEQTAEVAELTLAFERCWYGGMEPDRTSYEKWRTEYSALAGGLS